MASYRYLIVGGGMTADAACRGIRDHDPDGTIGVVGAEAHPPYARPPLSKALWKGKDESSIWRGTAELGVESMLGRRDRLARSRRAHGDRRHGRDARVRASCCSPPAARRAGSRSAATTSSTSARSTTTGACVRSPATACAFVVIGGGFIGSEIAAALAMNGCEVTMVFPEPGIGARIFPAELSAFVTDYYREQGRRGARRRSRSTAIERDGDVR